MKGTATPNVPEDGLRPAPHSRFKFANSRAVAPMGTQAGNGLEGAAAYLAWKLAKSVLQHWAGRAVAITRAASGAESAAAMWARRLAARLVCLALAPLAAPLAAVAIT